MNNPYGRVEHSDPDLTIYIRKFSASEGTMAFCGKSAKSLWHLAGCHIEGESSIELFFFRRLAGSAVRGSSNSLLDRLVGRGVNRYHIHDHVDSVAVPIIEPMLANDHLETSVAQGLKRGLRFCDLRVTSKRLRTLT